MLLYLHNLDVGLWLCLLVPTVISRGAPRYATWETSISEGRNYGREMAGQFGLRFRLPCKSQGSLTRPKSAIWDRRLYFPSEGRLAVDFFAIKIRQLRPGSNLRSWVPEASMLTTRPLFIQWLLHVSAKQFHPQGAARFLFELLQCQYGRRQVVEHMVQAYGPACYAVNCDGTLPSAYTCMHWVVFHNSSLHSTLTHRPIPYVPWLASTILTMK
jgi:hypothetical protein